jgi:flagellin
MSGVSISSNYAATAAANNLALSNSMLQRSLNRLSSGSRLVRPCDDAGGTAVAMRLEATAKRSGSAATNINNAISLLQNQEGALKIGGKIVERMAELQSLWNDTTKNADDKALYDIEFGALQHQLQSLTEEKFNGVNLFGATDTDIVTSAMGDQTLTISAKGAGMTGSVGSVASLVGGAAPASLPINGTITVNGKAISVVGLGSPEEIVAKINAAKGADVEASLDGGKLKLVNKFYGTTVDVAVGSDSADANVLKKLKLVADGGDTPTATSGTNDTRDMVSVLISAKSLGDTIVSGVRKGLNDVINDAQDEFASYRAANGAEQNGLGFASELLVVNKANLEAATGRIVDVDVAEESTQLAKWTTLTQAGTAMLAQANQSTALVLKLVGG